MIPTIRHYSILDYSADFHYSYIPNFSRHWFISCITALDWQLLWKKKIIPFCYLSIIYMNVFYVKLTVTNDQAWIRNCSLFRIIIFYSFEYFFISYFEWHLLIKAKSYCVHDYQYFLFVVGCLMTSKKNIKNWLRLYVGYIKMSWNNG